MTRRKYQISKLCTIVSGATLLAVTSIGAVSAADLSKAGTIEYVTFKAAEGVSSENLSKAAVAINDNMAKGYPGFVDRYVSLQDDGTWVEVVYWEDLKSAKSGLDKFLKDPVNAEFLGLVNPDSVVLTYSTIQK